MRIIVAGCGKIGSAIIADLVSEGHDIVAIDSVQAKLNNVTNRYDIMGVCGNIANFDILEEAEVSKAEIFIAVTGSDELNMVCCLLSRRMGAKHTIARIRNHEHNAKNLAFLRAQFELSMSFNPEYMVAQEMFNILKLPSAAKIEMFNRRNFEMVEVKLRSDSPIIGLSLKDLRRKTDANFLVCIVERKGKVIIPSGDFILEEGDQIGITTSPSSIQKILKKFGITSKTAKNVMILGASTTAFYLARMLINSSNDANIVEIDHDRCSKMAELLPEAVVINSDGSNKEELREAGLNNVDAFVSLTGLDEVNMLMAYYASTQDVRKVIAKVNRDELLAIADKLNIECTVSPAKVTSNVILRYVRALHASMDSNVETLYRLMGGAAEALEFEIKNDCVLNNKQIKNMSLKSGIIISGIIRQRKIIIPSGDDVILPGDRVVIIAAGHRINKISDIVK